MDNRRKLREENQEIRSLSNAMKAQGMRDKDRQTIGLKVGGDPLQVGQAHGDKTNRATSLASQGGRLEGGLKTGKTIELSKDSSGKGAPVGKVAAGLKDPGMV